MKSPMIENADYIDKKDKDNYSELHVMKSGAGYYIGTTYNDDGFTQPGSRDSGYYATAGEAQTELDLQKQGKGTIELRMTP